MAQGIVVKVWNVKAGSGTRSASAQISDSIEYIDNPEKTGVPLDLGNVNQIGNEITYVVNDMKTASGLYVGGRHISDIKHATEEMMQVKEFFGKMDGRVATHGIISLDASESDPRNAGKLMQLLNDLMESIFPEHQVVYAVHTNTENLHIHFIINTVGLDGKKIHMDKKFMREVMEPTVNTLAEKYGFTPNETWKKEKKKDPMPIASRKILLREMIDIAIEQTDEFDAFIAFLRDQGIIVNVGKNITVQTEEMPFAMRTGQLGENYSIRAIRRRLEEKYNPFKDVKAGDYYANILPEAMANITPIKMKAYKDMSLNEKRKAIHLIKLGRNPWNEARIDNWQMKRMADELKNVGYVYKLVHHYSKGTDNATTAMDAIVDARKAISAEKKEVRLLMKEYKVITGIYQEMKQHMVRAFLYDRYGKSEYEADFIKYCGLGKRLEQGYGKSVKEVADLVFELNAKLQYLKAQDKELSSQYLAIKKYVENGKLKGVCDDYSFFHAIGHSQAVYEASKYGICASDIKFIQAENCDVTIRVMTIPAVKDGKPSVESEITVIDKDDRTIKEFSSENMTEKEFNQCIYEVQSEYGIKKCNVSRKNNTGNLRHI